MFECIRCGRCCYRSVDVKGNSEVYQLLPCSFLAFIKDSPAKAVCLMYEERPQFCRKFQCKRLASHRRAKKEGEGDGWKLEDTEDSLISTVG